MSKEKKSFHSILLLVFLTISAYFLADTVDTMIGRSLNAAPRFTSPTASAGAVFQPKRELSDYSSILERGLFGDGKAANSPATAAVQSVYKLVGTLEGGLFAGAVLNDSAGVQAFYRKQEKLPDGSVIVSVKRDRVSLKRSDGTLSELTLEDDTTIVALAKPPAGAAPAGVKKVGEDRWMVDQREVAASTENMGQILTQARALPFVEQGKIVGFRISEIVPGSIYEKIGLQNGDVIQKVNAQDVDDPGKFFQLYQGLKEEKNISIDLLRNGQRQTFNFEIQ